MINLNQDSRCPGGDGNQAPPEYKSRALPLDKLFNNSATCEYVIIFLHASFTRMVNINSRLSSLH
jgi:hypothetical protein